MKKIISILMSLFLGLTSTLLVVSCERIITDQNNQEIREDYDNNSDLWHDYKQIRSWLLSINLKDFNDYSLDEFVEKYNNLDEKEISNNYHSNLKERQHDFQKDEVNKEEVENEENEFKLLFNYNFHLLIRVYDSIDNNIIKEIEEEINEEVFKEENYLILNFVKGEWNHSDLTRTDDFHFQLLFLTKQNEDNIKINGIDESYYWLDILGQKGILIIDSVEKKFALFNPFKIIIENDEIKEFENKWNYKYRVVKDINE